MNNYRIKTYADHTLKCWSCKKNFGEGGVVHIEPTPDGGEEWMCATCLGKLFEKGVLHVVDEQPTGSTADLSDGETTLFDLKYIKSAKACTKCNGEYNASLLIDDAPVCSRCIGRQAKAGDLNLIGPLPTGLSAEQDDTPSVVW